MVRQAWCGKARGGRARRGAARQARRGPAWYGPVRQGRRGKVWYGMVRQGEAWLGEAGLAWWGMVRQGRVRHGMARQEWQMTEVTVQDDGQINNPEVLEALQKIAENDEDGIIPPEVVVEQARDINSPLHGYFNWDDTEAAYQYRLWQARKLVALVHVKVIGHPQERVFVSVKVKAPDGRERRGYMPVPRAAAEPDLYIQIVADARAGIMSYRNRLSAFERSRKLVTQLDEVIAEMDREQEE